MSTTITIRSRCHLHKGRWIPEHKRGPRTITVRSRCHEHDGQWTPEPEGVLATIARAEGRPGQCAVGMRPVEPLPSANLSCTRTHWIHANDARCRLKLDREVPEKFMVGDNAFRRLLAKDPKRCCSWCRKAWEWYYGKEQAA